MIALQNVTFRYPAHDRDAITDISLEFRPGEVAWLTGALGSGTSTTLLVAAGLAPRLTGGSFSGSVALDKRDPALASPLAQGIAYLGASPVLQLSGIARTVRDEIAIGPMNVGWPRERIVEAVDEAIDRFDISHLAPRAPLQLSGGETQRVMLAALSATRPHTWQLDEPFAALDHLARAAMAELLASLAQQGETIVVTSDDADLMLGLATRLIVFEGGRVALDGSPAALLAGDEIGRTGAGTTGAATMARQAGIAAPRPVTTRELVATIASPLADAAVLHKTTDGVAVTPHLDAVLQLDGVIFRYPKGPSVLKGITLIVRQGESVGLFGSNGAGKSTLLRLAMALEHPSTGSVYTLGSSTERRGPEDFAPEVGFLFQQPERQLSAASVRAECRLAPSYAGWDEERSASAIDEVLHQLGLADVAGDHPSDLPLPRRRLVALAAVLVTSPRLLLLDEPTAGLDDASREKVARLVRERTAQGLTTLAITHDAVFAHEALDRAVVLDSGRVVFDGAVRDVLDGKQQQRPAALEIALALQLQVGNDRRDNVARVIAEIQAR